MASLIAKKLSKLPIGTLCELTYGDGTNYHEKVSGTITDSDFEANVEITTQTGEEIVLDFSIIRGVQVIKSLDAILRELPSGSKIVFSYGSEEQREPNINGVVVENDNEENLEIKTAAGEELVLNYSLIRSLLVKTKAGGTGVTTGASKVEVPKQNTGSQTTVVPKPVEKKALHQQSPEDFLNASDNRLKEIFDILPREDKKKLSSVYDSFKYGVKISDRDKMTNAANQAKQTLFREEDQGYYWSCEAVRFVGHLLRRVNIYDHEVFLVAECFKEAAFACWKEEKHSLAGAYAILALLGNESDYVQDMVIILASSVVKGDDISGLSIFNSRLPSGYDTHLRAVINEAFAAKGIHISADQNTESALNMLANLYTKTEMADEVNYWLPEESTASQPAVAETKPTVVAKPAEPEFIYGVIARLNWSDHTGTINGDDGKSYSFRYQDIKDAELAKEIQECLKSDLGGKEYLVKFYEDKGAAKNIQPDDALVDRARAIAADASRDDRFEAAFELCKKALDTSDVRRALTDLIKHAITLYTSKQQPNYVKEAVSLYEKYITYYPGNAFAIMDVAQCYSYMKKYPMMMEHAEKALSFPGLSVKQKIAVLSNYLRMSKEYYEVSGDKALLAKMLEKINELRESYSRDFAFDTQVRKLYTLIMVPYRVIAECGMDMLAEAEVDYANVADSNTQKPFLDELMAKTRPA